MSDKNVEDLQKACFIQRKTVEDFFTSARGVHNGILTKTTFMNALEELQLRWPAIESEQAFDTLC